jgi:tryptophan synthase alpha chain
MPAAAGTGRIARAFASGGRTGLIPFLTAGYPSLDSTLAMMRGFESLGARAVEIGIPFSDPIADGPEIQRASEWALRDRVGPEAVLDLVARFRESGNLPVVVMTYANPILAMGIEAFAARARAAGVDGVIVSDLPPDESPEVWAALDRAGLDTILLVAPTTEPARLPLLLGRCRGFVYCLARTGVTGQAAGGSDPVAPRVAELRGATKLPIAVGFGISNAADAARLDGVADAVIVGAAFMRAITEDPEHGAEARVEALAGSLLGALNQAR